MTTLAEITLQLAKEAGDVLNGSATVGNGANPVTTITDTTSLKQPAGHWEGGVLWFLSGTGVIGKAVPVTSFGANKLSFDSIGVVNPAVTARYAVCSRKFGWNELVKAVMQALEEDEARVKLVDETLTGNGTKELTLPAGVYDVMEVELKDSGGNVSPSFKWDERAGKLIFESDTSTSDTVRIMYRGTHPEVSAYSDTINSDINTGWLKWKAVENLMLWALTVYGDDPQKGYSNKMQLAMQKLQGLRARRTVDIRIRTA